MNAHNAPLFMPGQAPDLAQPVLRATHPDRTICMGEAKRDGTALMSASTSAGVNRYFTVPSISGSEWVEKLAFDQAGNPLLIGKDPVSAKTVVGTFEISPRVQSAQIRVAIGNVDKPEQVTNILQDAQFKDTRIAIEELWEPHSINERVKERLRKEAGPYGGGVQARYLPDTDELRLFHPVGADSVLRDQESFRSRGAEELFEVAKNHFGDAVRIGEATPPSAEVSDEFIYLESHSSGYIDATRTIPRPFQQSRHYLIGPAARFLATGAKQMLTEVERMDQDAYDKLLEKEQGKTPAQLTPPSLEEDLARADESVTRDAVAPTVS
jgi:hypothetical protein